KKKKKKMNSSKTPLNSHQNLPPPKQNPKTYLNTFTSITHPQNNNFITQITTPTTLTRLHTLKQNPQHLHQPIPSLHNPINNQSQLKSSQKYPHPHTNKQQE
ncbi:GA module-containing protein, partial [Staphylococcus aureus]|uniref:GA module-containing protein n=1 Tax=Staphylococcus aureus TaxID=1280 RepID=UPI00119EF30A